MEETKNLDIHRIIINKEKMILTPFNNKYYVLMKMMNSSNDRITLEELNKFKNYNYNITENKLDWKILWSSKIDYFEYQIEELKNKLPYIYLISDYFIGLAEVGISLMTQKLYKSKTLCHRRIYSTMEINELYNPFNMLIDDESRDFAEYYKELIFKGKNIDIFEYIRVNEIYNIKCFFIRLLYITPFFDMVDNVINYDVNDKEIKKIVKNTNFYEKELRKIYNSLLSRNQIEEINFLKEKM